MDPEEGPEAETPLDGRDREWEAKDVLSLQIIKLVALFGHKLFYDS